MLGGKGLVDAFLLNLIGHFSLGAGFFRFLLEGSLLDFQVAVLAGDFRFRLHFGELGFLFSRGFRDTLVLFLLRHIAGSHGINHIAVLVGEVLDGQVDNFQAHVGHISHSGLDGFLGELIPVLDQFGDGHLADDFTHVAFQHVLGQGLDLLSVIVKQLLGGGRNGQVVRSDLDVRHGVHQHGNVFLGGNGLGRPDIHLVQAHIQLVNPLNRRNIEGSTAADDPVAEFLGGNRAVRVTDLVVPADQAGDNQGGVRGSNLVPGDKLNDDDDCRDGNQDPVPAVPEEIENSVHRCSPFSCLVISVDYARHYIRRLTGIPLRSCVCIGGFSTVRHILPDHESIIQHKGRKINRPNCQGR